MSKDKWVRRFSVDETSKHKNGFTIYKITSVLFPIESPEAMTVVSVWKRYSDVQRLHVSMRSLHAGLHLRGTFPPLPKFSYFKRFQQEVIEERAKIIKTILEFVAEHKLLFTSTDFVNFLQTGYPCPEPSAGGVINAIRCSLHLPIEDTPPLEYQTSDDDSRSSLPSGRPIQTIDETDMISRIPVYEAAEVERRVSPEISRADSFESIASLESFGSDLYSELDKVPVQKSASMVKKSVLPDLINFDAPSTSKIEDYHTMRRESDTTSLSSHTKPEYSRSNSRVSTKSALSLSSIPNMESKTKTEDSYVFEAGYMLNLAARYEDMKEYSRAFECYKAGIEKMLIGVQSDTDQQRRALIKEKTNKYLSYAEHIYKNHLCNVEQSLIPEDKPGDRPLSLHWPVPVSMLRRRHEELALYRLIAVLGSSIMLVLHRGEQKCYAMKVIQKIPNNLTEFDEYFLQNTKETRQPILPTLIPYMVPLNAYIETNNLIFLILSYAPGEKLFDYIKNYAKSIPNTPAREVNLENVFSEPKIKKLDVEENQNSIIEIKTDSSISILDKIESNANNNKTENDNEISELVMNSQKLLENVDKVLSEVRIEDDRVKVDDVKMEFVDDKDMKKTEVERIESPSIHQVPRTSSVLPPTAVCEWSAQILTALESLHNYGVICRDLNPRNILLADGGQIILTYFISYPGLEMALDKLQTTTGEVNMYIAPELYYYTYLEEKDDLERACDYWSFGVIMYELLCGVPLTYYHRSVFTSHTILQLPDGLPVEVQSLLTQLLTFEPAERLGGGKDGIEEIKRHPYYKHIDWAHVYNSWLLPG